MNYTDRQLEVFLRGLADEMGKTPTQSEMNNAAGYPSASTFVYHFGSWSNAVEEAGLTPRGRYSDELLIERLQDLADEMGETPSQTDMDNAEGYPSCSVFIDRFGTWTTAVEEAGRVPQRGYSDELLIERLQDLADELGETPTRRDMDNAEGYPSSRTYINYFGAWTDALEDAGLEIQRGYSDELLIERLQDLSDELGKVPSSIDLKNADDYPAFVTYISRFGSWAQALEAAGLDSDTSPEG